MGSTDCAFDISFLRITCLFAEDMAVSVHDSNGCGPSAGPARSKKMALMSAPSCQLDQGLAEYFGLSSVKMMSHQAYEQRAKLRRRERFLQNRNERVPGLDEIVEAGDESEWSL
jgi:hypothetical protein